MALRDRFRGGGSHADKPEANEGRARPATAVSEGNGKGNGKTATSALNDRSQGLKARIHRRMVCSDLPRSWAASLTG